MATVQKISHKLYMKYEYLANKYASKIFEYEELSFEYEDLLQEFKLKIYTSIKSYGRRWAKYKSGLAAKPVPIRYYLECACGNKMRDFMKYISKENHKMRIDDISYDFGCEQDTIFSPEENKFQINGIDLLEGLTGKERIVYSMFLRGYNNKILSKVYFSNEAEIAKRNEIIKSGDSPITPSDIIQMQNEKLKAKYGNELLQQRRMYASYDIED